MIKFLKCVVGLFIGALMASDVRSQGQPSEFFITNPSTGVAIYGFDPVAYFDKHAALMGINGFETQWANAYWKFTNAANLERFRESPATYAPHFNGYGAYSVANGRLAEGNPLIWAIYQGRLLFFYSVKARDEWAKDPAKFMQSGDENWKSLRATLAR